MSLVDGTGREERENEFSSLWEERGHFKFKQPSPDATKPKPA